MPECQPSRIIPHHPWAILTHPRISQASSKERSSFHQGHHTRITTGALGRCLGARALEEMPRGKGMGWAATRQPQRQRSGLPRTFWGNACIHSQPWLYPCPHHPQLHLQPRKLSPLPANPFYSSLYYLPVVPESHPPNRERLTPQLLGPWQPLCPAPEAQKLQSAHSGPPHPKGLLWAGSGMAAGRAGSSVPSATCPAQLWADTQSQACTRGGGGSITALFLASPLGQ